MKKIFTITKWEYLEKVKTKSFLIWMLIFPFIMVGMSLLPSYFANKEDTDTKVFGLIESNIRIYEDLSSKLESYKLSNKQPNYLLRKIQNNNAGAEALKSLGDSLVFNESIRGYLVIEQINKDSLKITFRGENVSNIRDVERFEKEINKIITHRRILEAGFDIKEIEKLSSKFEIKPIKISKTGKDQETSFLETFMQGYVFTLILMMMILITGGMLIRSVVEEKSNRIIEVLVSSCTAKQLMAGKILGLSALGLTQVIVWGLITISIAGPAGATFISFDNLILTFVYFSLGYIFYSAIFVAVGSMANSEQEAQQFTSYISFVLIAPIIIVFQMMNNPDSTIVRVLSYFPLTLPPIMTMKVSIIKPSFWEIFTTVFIMVLSIYVMIWLAGKIFRVGILSYGKSPNLKQLIAWIKSK